MNYEEAVESVVGKLAVKSEIEKHGLDFSDFVKEAGERDFYQGKQVLDWLGY